MTHRNQADPTDEGFFSATYVAFFHSARLKLMLLPLEIAPSFLSEEMMILMLSMPLRPSQLHDGGQLLKPELVPGMMFAMMLVPPMVWARESHCDGIWLEGFFFDFWWKCCCWITDDSKRRGQHLSRGRIKRARHFAKLVGWVSSFELQWFSRKISCSVWEQTWKTWHPACWGFMCCIAENSKGGGARSWPFSFTSFEKIGKEVGRSCWNSFPYNSCRTGTSTRGSVDWDSNCWWAILPGPFAVWLDETDFETCSCSVNNPGLILLCDDCCLHPPNFISLQSLAFLIAKENRKLTHPCCGWWQQLGICPVSAFLGQIPSPEAEPSNLWTWEVRWSVPFKDHSHHAAWGRGTIKKKTTSTLPELSQCSGPWCSNQEKKEFWFNAGTAANELLWVNALHQISLGSAA